MIKDDIYRLLVNRVSGIQSRYQQKRNETSGIMHRVSCWYYLLEMNFSYYVLHNRELKYNKQYPYYEKKVLYSKGSESSLSYREKPEDFAERLARYDVISFDVFDTLIFRPFSSPADLFYILGDEIGYPDFQRIRQEMEGQARVIKYKKEKHYEVTLDEIYQVLEKGTGIPKDRTMELEIELEHRFCFANPYMLQVVKYLAGRGKRIIIISDMYLMARQIRNLLKKCGYPELAAVYVSCEYGMSKNKGDLYNLARQREGKGVKYAHVGDNMFSDIEQAGKHRMKAFYYENVNVAGVKYRTEDMSVITGSIYRGLVNAHIHNGLHCYSRFYEYGYIYGGLFVTGYCQFIHDYVRTHPVDKVLFLARDGDVLIKAYHIMYPDEISKCEYVYWSRLAAAKMSAERYKYDYFRRFLYHKVNQGYSIRQIMISMELPDMLDELCRRTGISDRDELSDKNVKNVQNYLVHNWQQVLAHYELQLAAGKMYYSKVLDKCRTAVAVDIGWAGSGAQTLDYIVNHIWKLDCCITGIIAGTNTCYNAEPNTSETFLQSGKLVSYMYSQRENRDVWKMHNPGKGHNLYWEKLLDSPMGSFQGFYPDGRGGYECHFKEKNPNGDQARRIQAGILSFVKAYAGIQKKIGNLAHISGRDAYAPMLNAEQEINQKFMKFIEGMTDNANIV